MYDEETTTLYGFLQLPTTLKFKKVHLTVYHRDGAGVVNHFLIDQRAEIESDIFDYLELPVYDLRVISEDLLQIDVAVGEDDDDDDYDDFDLDNLDIPPYTRGVPV